MLQVKYPSVYIKCEKCKGKTIQKLKKGKVQSGSKLKWRWSGLPWWLSAKESACQCRSRG